jgi:hypothetical protein
VVVLILQEKTGSSRVPVVIPVIIADQEDHCSKPAQKIVQETLSNKKKKKIIKKRADGVTSVPPKI